MKYAVQKDGQFNGILYEQVSPAITTHHAQFDETLVPVTALINHGTESAPDWQAVAASIEDLRAAMVCSRMQARIALHQAGLLVQAEAIVAQAGPVVQIAWADAVEFRRDNSTIATLAAALEPPLDDAGLDALFAAAMQITA